MVDATVELNPRFITLNSNNLRTKQDFGSRERSAMVDIILNDTALTAGVFEFDFSTIRNFTEVYTCVLHFPSITSALIPLQFNYLPTFKSTAGQYTVFNTSTGSNHSNPLTGKLTVEIRGI